LIPTKWKYAFVEKVNFKNYRFNDASLQLIAEIFPSLTTLDLSGPYITEEGIKHLANGCRNLKSISFWKCSKLTDQSLSHFENAKDSLERIIIFSEITGAVTKLLSFMTFCEDCNLLFNTKLNKPDSCLFHPGTWDGYGFSCSSFSCCGSSRPNYLAARGCQKKRHVKGQSRYLEDYLPELFDCLPEHIPSTSQRFYREGTT